ncbi:hypothetical protein [Leptolyngbya sp. FACHB-261]|uniref:hypothetical protein n=1 Tax=Leptolyngbya sp. FACHB-261 TaxID=2692806 RepID=UPI001683CF8D|nr:hypothetical protein [Leptolyngbya sp. FACHB-261]MBD2102592.1 hypothetical protein [Leptolyngbya sp. FACHB-261]
MTDFLTRLTQRTLGLTSGVQPVVASLFAPQQEMVGSTWALSEQQVPTIQVPSSDEAGPELETVFSAPSLPPNSAPSRQQFGPSQQLDRQVPMSAGQSSESPLTSTPTSTSGQPLQLSSQSSQLSDSASPLVNPVETGSSGFPTQTEDLLIQTGLQLPGQPPGVASTESISAPPARQPESTSSQRSSAAPGLAPSASPLLPSAPALSPSSPADLQTPPAELRSSEAWPEPQPLADSGTEAPPRSERSFRAGVEPLSASVSSDLALSADQPSSSSFESKPVLDSTATSTDLPLISATPPNPVWHVNQEQRREQILVSPHPEEMRELRRQSSEVGASESVSPPVALNQQGSLSLPEALEVGILLGQGKEQSGLSHQEPLLSSSLRSRDVGSDSLASVFSGNPQPSPTGSPESPSMLGAAQLHSLTQPVLGLPQQPAPMIASDSQNLTHPNLVQAEPRATERQEQQTASASLPTVEIRIGRIEVRANPPTPPATSRAQPTRRSPTRSLDDYLKQRNGG